MSSTRRLPDRTIRNGLCSKSYNGDSMIASHTPGAT